MRGKIVLLALLVGACSTEEEDKKPRDASPEPDSRLKDVGTRDQGLLSCKKACGGSVLCFSSVSLCESTCSAFVESAQDPKKQEKPEACSNCVIDLFKEGVCPNSYTEALVACEECELECNEGEDPCDDRCVDLKTDNFHCGKCDEVCDQEAFFVCTEGVCACADGLTDCSGLCTNVAKDTDNCGTCGKKCAAGDSCHDSVCCLAPGKKVCPISDTQTACMDVLANNANCGFCGVTCTAPETCQNGQCLPPTP